MPSLSSSRCLAGEAIAAALAELGRGDVERDRHVLAGHEAGPLDGRDGERQPFLVGVEGRPVAALVGDAGELAGLGEQRAGGAVDLGGHVEGFGEGRRRRPRLTMKSWMSTRRAAWAPPPKSWISGSGSRGWRDLRRDASTERHACSRRGGMGDGERHGDHGIAAEARLVRRAVEVDQAPSIAFLVGDVEAGERCGDLAVHGGDGAGHVVAAEARCRRRGGRRASPEPVEAPAGAMARPDAPPARMTSASTVGRPRESQTRRPITLAIFALIGSDLLGPGVADRCKHRRRRSRCSGTATRRTRSFAASPRHVLDRRLAVDAREKEAGQQRGDARLEIGARLPGHAARDRRRRAVEGDEEFACRRQAHARHFRRR